MNYLDILILIPLSWGMYRGFTKGFIISIASLAALFLGIYGAIYFSGIVATFLKEQWDFTSSYTSIFSFAITFIAIVILVHLLARLIDKLLKAVALGFFNRIAGVFFNVAKYTIMISIFLFIFNKFDESFSIIPDERKEKSVLYKPVLKIAPFIFDRLDSFSPNIKEKSVKENGSVVT